VTRSLSWIREATSPHRVRARHSSERHETRCERSAPPSVHPRRSENDAAVASTSQHPSIRVRIYHDPVRKLVWHRRCDAPLRTEGWCGRPGYRNGLGKIDGRPDGASFLRWTGLEIAVRVRRDRVTDGLDRRPETR
jgi:hypothetical protein